jgi:hypothetical protein
MGATIGILPERHDVVMERIRRRAQAFADQWTTADLQDPHVDGPAVEAAMQRYLAVRGEPLKPLRWFADGTSARAYIRSRASCEPKPAYWLQIGIARALDLAWFAGAMRPPIKINANWTSALFDWERWICVVTNFNAAFAREPTLKLPSELLPLADRFPEPPNAGLPIMDGPLAAVLAYHVPPPSRAVHPERLWMPLIEASASGLYFFWNGPDEIVCIPRPALWLANGRLHREDGPAVLWPSGEKHYFKHGREFLPKDTGGLC